MLWINDALWLVKRNHMTLNIQSEIIISAWRRYAMLKFIRGPLESPDSRSEIHNWCDLIEVGIRLMRVI